MSTSQRDDNKTPKPPKVVIINTQYVETDSGSFKHVVQKLTGKDSTVDVDDNDNGGRVPTRPPSNKSSALWSSGCLTRDVSFKDFERLLRETPPMDELWVD